MDELAGAYLPCPGGTTRRGPAPYDGVVTARCQRDRAQSVPTREHARSTQTNIRQRPPLSFRYLSSSESVERISQAFSSRLPFSVSIVFQNW